MAEHDFNPIHPATLDTKYFYEESTKRIYSIPKRPIDETDQETLEFLNEKKTKFNEIKGVLIPLALPLSAKEDFDCNNNLFDLGVNDQKCHSWFKIYFGDDNGRFRDKKIEIEVELDFITFVILQYQSEYQINKHFEHQEFYKTHNIFIYEIDYPLDHLDIIETNKFISKNLHSMNGYKKQFRLPFIPSTCSNYKSMAETTNMEEKIFENIDNILQNEKEIIQELVYNSSLKSEYNPENKKGYGYIEKLISIVLRGKKCRDVWEFLEIYFDKCIGTKEYNKGISAKSFCEFFIAHNDFQDVKDSKDVKNAKDANVSDNDNEDDEGNEDDDYYSIDEIIDTDEYYSVEFEKSIKYCPYDDDEFKNLKFLKKVSARFDESLGVLNSFSDLLKLSFTYFV